MSNPLTKTTISVSALIGLLLLLLGCSSQPAPPAVASGSVGQSAPALVPWLGWLPGAGLLGSQEVSACEEAKALHSEAVSGLDGSPELEARYQAALLSCRQGG
jgi:hypothetical protein